MVGIKDGVIEKKGLVTEKINEKIKSNISRGRLRSRYI